MTLFLRTLAAAFVLALLAAAPARAVVIVEAGEPNDSPAQAQDAGGIEVTGIQGNLDPANDTDVFKFTFLESVSVRVFNLLPAVAFNLSFDIVHLVIVDDQDDLVDACFDCWLNHGGNGFTALFTVLQPGVYFLAVFDTSEGLLQLGDYSMDIEILPAPAQAPEPATLALTGLGLAGLALARRRRRA